MVTRILPVLLCLIYAHFSSRVSEERNLKKNRTEIGKLCSLVSKTGDRSRSYVLYTAI